MLALELPGELEKEWPSLGVTTNPSADHLTFLTFLLSWSGNISFCVALCCHFFSGISYITVCLVGIKMTKRRQNKSMMMIYIHSWGKIIDELINLSYPKNIGINYNAGVIHKGIISRDEVREIQSHKCWLWKRRVKAVCQGTQVNSRSWGWLTGTSPQRNGNFNPRTAWNWIWLPTWINVEADSSPATQKWRKACWHLDFSPKRPNHGLRQWDILAYIYVSLSHWVMVISYSRNTKHIQQWDSY